MGEFHFSCRTHDNESSIVVLQKYLAQCNGLLIDVMLKRSTVLSLNGNIELGS
jgi:hypothetical protein